MVKLRPTRKLFYMRSKHDELTPATLEWIAWFRRKVACHPDSIHPGAVWREKPTKIDVALTHEPKGTVAAVFKAEVNLIREDLYGVLRPYLTDFLIGRVTVEKSSKKAQSFVSLVAYPAAAIDPYRGPAAIHVPCPECGRLHSTVMNDDAEGIAESNLDERRIYGDAGSMLYVDSNLIKELRLKERFPDLRFIRWPVIPRPLDGDVLPGDPGWDGVFRPQAEKLKVYEQSLPKVSAQDLELARKVLSRAPY